MSAWFAGLGLTGKLIAVALAVAALIGAVAAAAYGINRFAEHEAAGGAAQANATNLQAQVKAKDAAITDQIQRQAAGNQVGATSLQRQADIENKFTPIEQEATAYAQAHPPRPVPASQKSAPPIQLLPGVVAVPDPTAPAVDSVLDPLGLCLWNAANRGSFDGAAKCGSDAAMPAAPAAAAAGVNAGPDGAKPRAGDAGLLHVRGAQPGQDRLDQQDHAERLIAR